MKLSKIIMTGIAALAIAGCTTDPTIEDMQKAGQASGYTTAWVLNNQVEVDDATRNSIIDIMNEVEKYVPETNATYEATWTPIAKKFVDKGVAEGKITQEVADRVMKDFGYVTGLLDKYIEKKGIKGKQDLVDAFIHSFFSGFLTNFKPANMMSASIQIEDVDKLTVEILDDLILDDLIK